MVLTRPLAQSGGAAAALAKLGARVKFCPLIKVVPPKSWKPLDAGIRLLSSYDAVAFTSVNAVDFFFRRCRNILGRVPAMPLVVAAVGASTGKAVAARGWRCSVIPEDARAAGLAKVLRVPRGARVLIPRAERGLTTLATGLRKAGARVTSVPAYKTVADEAGLRALRLALIDGADAVLFASGSAAAVGARDTRLAGAAAIAIGPTTAAALRSHGIKPAAIAKKPDAASFARAAADGLKGRP